MKLKKWAIQKLLKWSKILNVEQALRDAYKRGGDEREKKLTQRVNVWYDPSVRAYPQPQKIINPRGRYFKAHHLEFMPKQEVVRTNTEPPDSTMKPPDWLVGINDPTAKVPAVKKQAYQEYQKRHAG